jgi:cell wall-associated NlpC family hydrolase
VHGHIWVFTAVRRIRDHDGSISVSVAACVLVALILCLCLTDVGLFLAARSRAQNAADAAALAAVQESFPLCGTGLGPNRAASNLADANSAMLEKLEVSSGGERVQVQVSVKQPSLFLRRLGVGPARARAQAAAEIDIDSLLACKGVWYTTDPAVLANLLSFLSGSSGGDFGGASTLVTLLSLQHLGKPYVWGASGPNCFDCSGLVCYVFAQIGLRLPRVTFAQVSCGIEVAPSELAPGDLVFFRKNAHVGIYLGAGCFIHASHTGEVVKISSLGERSDLSACRRVLVGAGLRPG